MYKQRLRISKAIWIVTFLVHDRKTQIKMFKPKSETYGLIFSLFLESRLNMPFILVFSVSKGRFSSLKFERQCLVCA